MNYFRQDNTEGYTDQQLMDLNARLVAELDSRGISDNPDEWSGNDRQIVESEAERILND